MKIEKEKEKIVVKLKSRKEKIRCPECNEYTGSVHSKLKPC